MDKKLPDTKIPNLIKELEINKPNQVWCADFTYLKFQGLWYYLATVIDAYTKEIVGFHLSTSHQTELVIQALETAIRTYQTPEINHSDQGSEYRSFQYQELLKANNIKPSNSAKSSPWQNGFQESFYGKFKQELELNKLPKTSTFADIYNYIANQIDYYNNYRIHTTICNIPSKFRTLYFQENRENREKKDKRDNQEENKINQKPQQQAKNNQIPIKTTEENLVY